MIQRKQIQVRGIVQSVGFRPFVYALAERYGLNGCVLNNECGVLLDVEGQPTSIDQFLSDLQTKPPPLAQIEKVECRDYPELAFFADFRILPSSITARPLLSIAPDVATCRECVGELFDPGNRRYRYPFINCTNCGPRFTIVQDVPYDRARTTMRDFEMCAECRAEYENPNDRRFHAEPIACAKCGPNVFLISGNHSAPVATGFDAIAQTKALLNTGKIVAIKGLGGFHLACDAANQDAVAGLRARKYREEKPFALMAGSIDIITNFCELSAAEEKLLDSAARPVVLLRRRTNASLAAAVAPRVNTLGFMLPYTPLHYLLLEDFRRPLVMTSANVSDEPICYEDEDARERLHSIADYFLLHDRRIHMRSDDSVARIAPRPVGRTSIIRRARGYAPAAIKTAFRFERQILACGAELKNTFCLARDDQAFVSHHIGDLENVETLRSFTEGIEHFERLFYLRPEAIAYDLHPEYLSTKYAMSQDHIELKLGVQHHHAHIASCMADNRIEGDVIGVAMDGLGFGTDGKLWGGEFFVANFAEATRVAHLEYMPLPGGTKAIQEPWRMAAAYLLQEFGADFPALPFVRDVDAGKVKIIRKMISAGANTPETSSMGRLFDAVSSLLRLRDFTNYEGQAAIELEQIAASNVVDGYQFQISPGVETISARPVVRSIVNDLLEGVPAAAISAKFHVGVADLISLMACEMRQNEKLNRVVLSGGVFQNHLLLELLVPKLAAAGFEVFTHSRVPANDGGISLGQAAVANAVLKRQNARSQHHARVGKVL